MHDSASSHSRTYGIQRRVPAAPMDKWRITKVDQLPDHLKRILETYPPYLTTKRAIELNGTGKAMYARVERGDELDDWPFRSG